MRRRNWLALSRKLVDVSDLAFSFESVAFEIARNNLSFFGSGVLSTTTFPNPFVIAMSSSVLHGTITNGIAFDPTGFQIKVDDGLAAFDLSAADATNSRWDLVVLRFKSVGNTLIPEPDQPTTNIYLNLYDGYQVVVLPGTPSATPTYPTKGQNDVILAGVQVPAGTATGAGVFVDLAVRELSQPSRVFFPVFKQEQPSGTVDGVNQTFQLSYVPLNAQSLLISLDGIPLQTSEYGLSGQAVTLQTAPAIGQSVYAYYVVNSPNSVNPVSGFQEVPTGTIDGQNLTFQLSQNPVDQNSTQIYIDGIVANNSTWSLVQGQTSQIVFNAGQQPVPGQTLYAFYLRNSVAQATAQVSGGGGSINLSTEYPQLQASDITNGYVILNHTPVNPSSVLLDVLGDTAQAYGSDFTVSGNQLTWLGTLQTVLSAGDQLRIHYNY